MKLVLPRRLRLNCLYFRIFPLKSLKPKVADTSEMHPAC